MTPPDLPDALGASAPFVTAQRGEQPQPRQASEHEAARKQSVYLPSAILAEIKEQSIRQDRSVSWLIQRAWLEARERILAYAQAPDVTRD